jgi:hypothetical protein
MSTILLIVPEPEESTLRLLHVIPSFFMGILHQIKSPRATTNKPPPQHLTPPCCTASQPINYRGLLMG